MGSDEVESIAASTGRDEALPEQIGERYRVEGLLGRGGMAAVYRVHDLQRQRTLALKCALGAKSSNQHARLSEMLAREYRTLAQLSHPSVISVYEYGQSSRGPFYTMELLEGSDLQQLAPVPWRTACMYLRDVASCLSLLHSRRLLHRDVSPRNIRCQDQHAKLLDFGALAQMGPNKQIVGTPPNIPPEALHHQDLDGRGDLYGLGATLYWALTQRHAYPARSLAELAYVWRQRPAPPSTHAPDVPEALDTLVMSLLSHEVQARPRSAAEVMEQLTRIAGLADDESLHVSQAYLTTPSLQGREAELAEVRDALTRLKHGRSCALWLEGEAGMGRTRLLEAALLDASLAGVSALHLRASDLAPGPLALARELFERALEQLGESRSSRELLAALYAERGVAEDTRTRLFSRLRALIRCAGARGPFIVAIDDVDAADPASQALLASLLVGVRRNLLLLFTALPGRPLDPALAARRAGVDPIVLRPLFPSQTEALLSSVFGDVPGVPAVAARVHELSHGNPRATMELAGHLVATGKVRYALGGWELPRELPRTDLPTAWTTALDTRLLSLSDDARELAELIAFSFEYGFALVELDALSSHGNAERRQLALDSLLAAGIVHIEGDNARFLRGADRERIAALANTTRVRESHARFARRLAERGEDPLVVARCLLRANNASAALDLLLAELTRGSRCDTAPADYASLLTQAIEAATALGRPRAHRFRLLRELVNVGDHLGVADIPARFAELFEQLRVDSGLAEYEALPETLAPIERLQKAFAAAQARHDGLAPADRVLAPIEAIQTLAMTVRHAAAFAATSLDYGMIESLPVLTAFTPLSDMLKTTIEHTLPASAHLIAGRYEQARDGYLVTLARLTQPDHGGLDEEFWRWAVNALRFALGHINAGLSIAEALDYARQIERDEVWMIGAWDVRRAYYLRQGDWREAEACRGRIERLRLQSDRRPPMVDTSARLELDSSAHAGDLLGARRASERLRELIGLHPGYACYAHYGPAVCEYLRGNYITALEQIDRALALVSPGKHPTWPWIVSCRLDILLALGRNEQARADGLRYFAQAEAAGLQVMADHITVSLALAEAKLGAFDSAVARIEHAIRYREELGSTGLNLGWAYEARARVAIWMRDEAAFARAGAACAREYGRGRGGSSFASKYEALRTEARQARMLWTSEMPPPRAADSAGTYMSTLSGSAAAFEARVALALEHLANASGARNVVLYRLHGDTTNHQNLTLECCASNLEGELPEHAFALITSVLSTSLDDDSFTTASLASEANATSAAEWRYVALGYMQHGRFLRTGAALFRFDDGAELKALPIDLAQLVGRLLGERAVG